MKDFSNITIGQYYPVASLVHRLDPRLKINLALFLIVAIFAGGSFFSLSLITLFLLAVVLVGKLPLSLVLRGLRPLLYIVIITLVIHLFFTPGEIVTKIGFLKLTREGIRGGLFISLRLVLLVLGTSLLTLTTTPIELTDGMEQLLKPLRLLKVPAHELAMMITIALRFIPTLLLETDRLIKAQMARGADFESRNLLKRIRNLLAIIIPLFAGAFRRADELALAMDSRCYRGGVGRTRMRVLRMKKTDWLSLAVATIFLLVVVAVGYL